MTSKWIALSDGPDLTEHRMASPYFPDYEMLACKGAVQDTWHERARQTASDKFGSEVFVRGVVEVSNYCRENCHYCGMRRDNRSLDRFRAQHDQLAELLIHHRPSSITDINLQSGEDPVVVRQVVLPLIQTLRRETPLGISVCLGTLDSGLYAELQAAGASIYIIKFEIGTSDYYAQMHAPGTFAERLEHIKFLAGNGWSVSSGFIAGLPGQRDQDLIENFKVAKELPLSGCSVSPFIPGDETPLASAATADIGLTLNCMAALRLMRPDWIIPAVSALNIADGVEGYRRGLRTGANLVTINLTPSDLRNDYLLYKRDRIIMTEERILAAIAAEGLTPSSQSLAAYYQNTKERNGKALRNPAAAAAF